MCRKKVSCWVLAIAVVSLVMVASSARAATVTIAEWKFDQGNFLGDSSGHGYSLLNNGATQDTTQMPQGDGCAYFNGAAAMKTNAAVVLSPYSQVTAQWWELVKTSSVGILFEPDAAGGTPGHPGAIGVVANNSASADKALLGGTPSADGKAWSILSGSSNTTWEQYQAIYDITATGTANRIHVNKNTGTAGSPIWTEVSYVQTTSPTTAATAFTDWVMCIGARQYTPSSVPYTGYIDDLKITGTYDVPEPSSVVLLVFAVSGLAVYAWRKRK